MINTLKDFPGQDAVRLCINSEGRVDKLKLSGAGYCSELHRRLAELVGEEGLKLEPTESA